MKIAILTIISTILLGACGSDSNTTSQSGDTASGETYTYQCTFHKKVMNSDTGNTKDFTYYEKTLSYTKIPGQSVNAYQDINFETDETGKYLPGAKVYYGVGELQDRDLSANESESTDTYYETGPSFQKTSAIPEVTVNVWRKNSSTEKVLVSQTYNHQPRHRDQIRTVREIDEASWYIAYAYPNPDQFSSGNQRVLTYSKTCMETYYPTRIQPSL